MKILKLLLILILFPTVAFCGSSSRIISLAPAITEILYALDAGESIAGVTDYCDYPPDAKEKPSIGGFINPNIEKIIALNPDLVILSPNSGTKTIKEKLDRFNLKNQVVSFYTLNDLREAFLILGEIVDRKNNAESMVKELDGIVEEIQVLMNKKGKGRPDVLFVRSHSPLYVAGRGTYEDDIIDAAGGMNCVKWSNGRYPNYNIEEIIRLNPEIIIDATYYDTPSKEEADELLEFWGKYKGINAVKSGKVYIIKTDIHSVPGPRTAECIKILAQIIHPELFGVDVDDGQFLKML